MQLVPEGKVLIGLAENNLHARVCRLKFGDCKQSLTFSALEWTFPFYEGKTTYYLFISLECCEDKLFFYSFRIRTII